MQHKDKESIWTLS